MHLNLGQKISLAVLVVFGLHVGAFVLTQLQLTSYRANTLRLANETLPQMRAFDELNISATQIIQQVSTYLASGDVRNATRIELSITAARTQLQQLRATAQRFDVATGGEESSLDQVEGDLEQLVRLTRTTLARSPAERQQNREQDINALVQIKQTLDSDLMPLLAVITQDQAETVAAAQFNPLIISTILTALITGVVGILLWSVRTVIILPVKQLTTAVTAITAGAHQYDLNITSQDEIGILARSFTTMVTTIQEQNSALRTQTAQATSARDEAEHARAAVEEQLVTIANQREAIREMSVPVLPLSDTTMVMPLVGVLDTERLQVVQERALNAIEHSATRHLILDITGVPVVDTQVAQGLIQVVRAARLLGTVVVLAGIRPEVAQTIVGLGLQLNEITTRSTLQASIADTLVHRTVN